MRCCSVLFYIYIEFVMHIFRLIKNKIAADVREYEKRYETNGLYAEEKKKK